MIELFKLNHTLSFPAVDFALEEPNGLLAFGGDLSVNRLVAAYQRGIFPWYNEGEPILWWSPSPRAIFEASTIKANKSLRKSIKKYGYTASLNNRFNDVINACANVPRGQTNAHENEQTSTWINEDMISAYKKLHELGFAHSVEVYNNEHKLVGGLYGVVVSGIFCGESMFHYSTDASKTALLALAQHMYKHGLEIIDCQLVNDHLQRLGCKAISRQDFQTLLIEHRKPIDCWHSSALEIKI